ncbi:Na+/H+ dicarboxylate symporter [Mizugakiibacter sediminis]|uniref:Na+/H+ dicarboxylate symporter n=1 Tax=Mizugakiibacter sediminis TaxID=1475481 RepID=A0A0K8QKL1_9GAMM|nr:dicarboxylate/amino acid:cation symporter [Mizugakiibacter sediminis]GAP65398.1 Na+/H+ dicarboxylate symporter [Mizugakiibacter sediminis]
MSAAPNSLASRILWGLVAGVLAGVATLAAGAVWPGALDGARRFADAVLDPVGQVFLRMLFFVVLPLVFASLAGGVAQLGRLDRLGPLAGRTFLLFVANMGIAVALGLAVMNLLQPGRHLDAAAKAQLLQEYGGSAQQQIARQAERPPLSFEVVVEMFMPRNLFGAVVGQSRDALGDVLPLILFAILAGGAAMRLGDAARRRFLDSMETIGEVMTHIVHLALRLAPYAVPALMYGVIVKVGADILLTLSVFVLGCAFALLLHLFGTMSIWLMLLAKRRPLEFFRSVRAVLVTAFSTSSSNATLPAALAASRETLGLAPGTAGFVLPLGTTMNMSGTALFEGCVVLFVAQAFGIELSLGHQLVLMMLAVLSAVAVAGIPGGSMPLIAGLLINFGVPAEGIGIVLGVDRLLDMTRTMVNVGSDMVTATVVDAQVKRAEARGG